MKIKTEIHYYNEINRLDKIMTKAVILTKLKNLSVILNQPWFGNLYLNCILPLTEGEVTLRNLSNIDMHFNEQQYVIRVDKLIEKNDSIADSHEVRLEDTRKALAHTVDQFKELKQKFLKAGEDLYIKLTDADTIEEALGFTNSFNKDGVNVIAIKRETGMVYKVPFDNKMIEFTDPKLLFLFLGSLANVFLMNQGQPDPRWFKENSADNFPF